MQPRYRWVVLALGILAQAAFAAVMLGFPAIGPAVRQQYGLSLPAFGAVLGAVTGGATVALVPWGLLTDRIGERRALALGLGGAGVALGGAAVGGAALLVAMLFLVGVLGGVTNVASGRAVMGWFDFSQRGTAFGLRQAAVPLGGATAAFTLPALVAGATARAGLLALGAGCLGAAAACALWLRDPAAPAREGTATVRGPLRDSRVYVVALASALLVSAQVAVIGFVALFLHDVRAVAAVGAGAVLASIQVAGVGLRVGVGWLSDRRRVRVALLRRAAAAVAVAWVAAPLAFGLPVPALVAVLVVAGALAFGWNGLAFNAAAEYAPPGRAGTAIAVQQTALFAAAAVIPPAFGWLVSATSWQTAYALVAVGPAAAWALLRRLAHEERAAREAAGPLR